MVWYTIMEALQLFTFKDRQGELTVEMEIWKLQAPTKDRPHGLKYRLYCGRLGRCVVRYDNETGKGDHRHKGNHEEPYRFESVSKLINDFRADCSKLAGWRWK
ncbi:MAG: toxin-antitoxin system TumE family protein [Chromatiales bacterium]